MLAKHDFFFPLCDGNVLSYTIPCFYQIVRQSLSFREFVLWTHCEMIDDAREMLIINTLKFIWYWKVSVRIV